ncbi:hypothetical protein [Thalassolituus sp. UBA2590]|uniref:hypothetical protein n=1 Tax=Thalassolituus sp. UBA2590 TaxID=1947663 RepID=UPI002648B648|nr:hypothetical protein [Thalassolituus sp. UBA2590]
MSQLLAGHNAGFRVRAQNEIIEEQFTKLSDAAKEGDNYWAVQAINTLRSLASGYNGDNVYVSVDNRYADGRTLFKIVMPGCEAYVRHESNGELLILKIQASDDYAQMQNDGKKPGYFELEYNERGQLAPEPKQTITKTRDRKTVVICGGQPTINEARQAAIHYVKAMKIADAEDVCFVHTPSDSNSFRGNRRINSRKADKDPAMRESALIVRDLMLSAQGIGKVKWITQGAGSGITYQALMMKGGQELNMKGHWLYLAGATTSAPALEQQAVTLGFTTDRDNKYYDSLNPDQLIGSGRLQGGNILTAWRRLRSGRDTEYTPLKFGVDAGKEALMMNSTFNSVSAVQKALVVAGASTGLASGATAIAGLGIALLGVGGIAFHSFFPEEYHNSKDKF